MGVETTADQLEDTSGPEDLQTRIDLLEAENRALREAAGRRHKTRYRRTAIGLVMVGLLSGLTAIVFPGERTVLFALAGAGVFAGLLTYYLTPERFISATVSEATYNAYADTVESIEDELGLADPRVYVPHPSDTVLPRLFLPQHSEYAIPEALDSVFVTTEGPDQRGVSLTPSGAQLFREFERTISGPLADDPQALADQLADGLVEGFELADRATPEVDAGNGRVTVGIDGPAFGEVDRVDHPVQSFLAVGLAEGLDQPIVAEPARTGDARAEYLVTLRWASEGHDASGEEGSA